MNILLVLSGILLLCTGVNAAIGADCSETPCDDGETCGDDNKCGNTCTANSNCTEASQICTGTKTVCKDTLAEPCDADIKCGTDQACGDADPSTCVAKCADVTTCAAETQICAAKATDGRMFCRVTLDKACDADAKCGTDQACGSADKCVATCVDDTPCAVLTQRCSVKSGGTQKFCRDTMGQACDADDKCGTTQKCTSDKCADIKGTTCAADGDCGSAYICSDGKKCAMTCADDKACDKKTEKCLGTKKTCTMTLNIKCTKAADCGSDQECTGGTCSKKGGASALGASLLLVLMPILWSLLVN